MNNIESIRKAFNSNNSVIDREVSDFELIPEINNTQAFHSYTINVQELKVNKEKTLTPLIFCNRKYKTKIHTKSKQRFVVFENMLSNVVYAYYSSEYEINSIMRSITENLPVEEKQKKTPVEQVKKRGRRRKYKLKRKDSKESGSDDSPANEIVSMVDDKHLLDYLVSPLKFDFEYG